MAEDAGRQVNPTTIDKEMYPATNTPPAKYRGMILLVGFVSFCLAGAELDFFVPETQ